MNKTHWYDGLIYDKYIAPHQDILFRLIKGLIKPDSVVIDVGCGTGRLPFQLAPYCKEVVGIDLSIKNIQVALKNKKLNNSKNVNFFHSSVEDLLKENSFHFDYAVITYVIHEVKPEERLPLIENIKKLADLIIIGDYIVPMPRGFIGYLTGFVEFIAGREHYAGFKDYIKHGGIDYLIKEAGLSKIKEIKGKPESAHLVVVK